MKIQISPPLLIKNEDLIVRYKYSIIMYGD